MLPILLSVLAIFLVLTPQVFTLGNYIVTKFLPKTPSWVKVTLGVIWLVSSVFVFYIIFILTIFM